MGGRHRGVLTTRRTNMKSEPMKNEPRPKLSTKELSALLEVATSMSSVTSGKVRSARLSRQDIVIEDQARRLGDQERELITLKEENQMLKKRLRSQEPRWPTPTIQLTRLPDPKATQVPEPRKPDRTSPRAAPKDKVVETPGYVFKRVPSSSHQEYRELVEEDDYGRRHSKAEAEEKKIIRRDRAREREAEMRRKMIESPRYTAYTRFLPRAPTEDEAEPVVEEASPTHLPITVPKTPNLDLRTHPAPETGGRELWFAVEAVLIVDSLPKTIQRKRILAAKVVKKGRKPR